MLHSLTVKDFVTIENLNIDFEQGLSVITGDSGAGKSIILNALNLALGSRVDKSFIKSGKNKAYIIACFSTSNQNIINFLNNNDISADAINGNIEIILRRTIDINASKSFINDIPTSLTLLQQLSLLIIDISSQNSHQLLLKNSHQLKIIDSNSPDKLLKEVKKVASNINIINQKILDIEQNSGRNKQQLEFLSFQLEEFNTLDLSLDELENIENNHKIINNSKNLIEGLSTVSLWLEESDFIDKSISIINDNIKIESKLSSILEMLESAKININEAKYEIDNYLSLCNFDDEEINHINSRMVALNDLSRKHSCQIIDLLDKKITLEKEFESISKQDESTQILYLKKQELELSYKKLSNKLTIYREKSVTQINKTVTATIEELGMPGAMFEAKLIQKDGIYINGNEVVEFLIKTNAGGEFKILKKTASGGELSRISLAISLASSLNYSSNNSQVETLVFDEVDVGISGNAASVVGEKLKQLSKTTQIICITHLPQVASFANQHLLINKQQQDNNTITDAYYLDDDQRINEISRIMGGDNISDKTIALATEMINKNGK